MKDITMLGAMMGAAIKAYGEGSERSVQSAEGRLGPSDLGFCRQKAVLMTRGVEQSDSTSIAAAQVGTAVHAYVADALRAMFPNWIIEGTKITATFPSGVQVSGTPDAIALDWNALVDTKTVDGFQWVKREGTSQAHKYQRHTYALAAIQAGYLNPDKPIYVCNLYIDRSGKEPEPYFLFEEYDPTLTDEIDSWISDVTYAVRLGEDGMRDIPAPICQQICSYYTVCRGGLPMEDGGESIADEERIAAIRMYLDAKAAAKEAGKDEREAKARLVGTNGVAMIDGAAVQVRWTHINDSEIAATVRAGYDRIDVRPIKGGK